MKLYVYECCPYCAFARAVYGLHCEPPLIYLPFNDESVCKHLVGKKTLPILELDNGHAISGSDVIGRILDTQLLGPPLIDWNYHSREDVKFWLGSLLYGSKAIMLEVSRFAQLDLPELKSPGAREYYIQKHKEELGGCDPQQAIQCSHQHVHAINKLLHKLSSMIHGHNTLNEDGHLTPDDIRLLGFLRNLTVVGDLIWPPRVRSYVEQLAARCRLNLFFDMAF